MKSDKQIKKELYKEYLSAYEKADPKDLMNLENSGLVNITYDKEEWKNALPEERRNKEIPFYTDLKKFKEMSLNEIEKGIKLATGKKYHLFDYHNQMENQIYQGYENNQYSQYQSDQAKMLIPFIHCNSEDKSFKDVGVFENLQELKEHLINELNEYAGCDWDEKKQEWFDKEDPQCLTKAEDIQLIVKRDEDEEIKEMAFVSTKWGNHHFWLINDEDTIRKLEETIERSFSDLEINEDIDIPKNWEKYDTSYLSYEQQKEFCNRTFKVEVHVSNGLKKHIQQVSQEAYLKQKMTSKKQKTKDDEEMEMER